jgi:hypothetical protein
MKTLKPLALMAIAAVFLLAPADKAHAQVAVSIGEAPGCPSGYYEAPPYNCAPDGYYGPEWFGGGGIFIGAGLGITGRIISTATSIINSTIARATTGLCLRVARLSRNTAQSFTGRPCMMYMDTRHLADTNR